MMVYVNGRFVPDDLATVSAFDRGFLYGDGLFETVPVHDQVPFLWDRHLDRFQHGARMLRIQVPHPSDALPAIARELLARNQLTNAVLRLALSRGRGPRGYSPKGAQTPTFILAAFPAPPLVADLPPPIQLVTASLRVPLPDPFPGLKSANRLLHVLARAEADDVGAEDALLLNPLGHVAETTSANVFWFDAETLHTPPLSDGALAGVTREFVLRHLAPRLGLSPRESTATPGILASATGAFLTLSTRGIVEIGGIDRRALARDPRTARLRAAYAAAVRA